MKPIQTLWQPTELILPNSGLSGVDHSALGVNWDAPDMLAFVVYDDKGRYMMPSVVLSREQAAKLVEYINSNKGDDSNE